MPTLFQNLDVAFEGSALSDALPQQATALSNAAGAVAALIADPPDSLNDFTRVLNELDLPDLLGDDFGVFIQGLSAAVPGEIGDVTGDLTAGLLDLQANVSGQLAGVLENGLAALRAIHRVTQMDFTCFAPDGPEATPAEGGGTPPEEEGSPEPASEEDDEPSAISQANAQLDAVNGALDNLPTPFTAAGFIDWLRQLAAVRHQTAILAGTIPLIDDVIDPLNTLTHWHGSTSEEIRDHMIQSVEDLTALASNAAPGRIERLATDLSAAGGSLDAVQLQSIFQTLTAGLTQLAAAVDSGDLSGTGAIAAEIENRLDDYQALQSAMAGGLMIHLASLCRRLETLGDDLADEMGHLTSVLRPNPDIGALGQAVPPSRIDPDIAAGIRAKFEPLADWLNALLSALDIQGIQEPIQSVADTVQEGVDGMEQGLTQVTIQVRSIFGELEDLLNGFDAAAMTAQVEAAITDFETRVTGRISDLFEPVRDAVSAIIGEIDGQVDAFDPEALTTVLEDMIHQIQDVLSSAETAVGTVREALETVKNEIEGLSFAPVTDGVTSGLESIEDALAAIDPSLLNAALNTALQAALSILPDDLQPLTDPLIDEFGELVESGPASLLETVKTQPQKLLDKVRAFEPAALVGEVLSEPFEALLERMETFRPTALLEPVSAEIDALKDRLKAQASPGRLLSALEPPFDDLLSRFDRLDPEGMVAPLDDAVSGAVDEILAVLPVDDVLDGVNKSLDVVRDISGFGQRLAETLQRSGDILDGLANADAEVDAWVTDILDKVSAIGDMGPLQARFDALTSAIDATRAADLQSAFDGAVSAMETDLAALDPEARHAALVQAHARFPRSGLNALLDSAEKSAIQAALDRFDPLDPDFGAPFQVLRRCRRAVAAARNELTAALADWDHRYHGPGSTLSGFRIAAATPAAVRDWLATEIDRSFLPPLKAVLAHLGAVAVPLDAAFGEIEALVAAVQEKIDELLLGPAALASIADSLDNVIQRLRDFNLDFLTDSLTALFAEVRAKIEAVHPKHFKAALDDSFDAMLDRIGIDLILDPADLQDLDDAFDGVVQKLRALNPDALLAKTVQPLYDETIAPMIEAFDITPVLAAIIDRLRNLDEELKSEMARINEAFRNLKRAVPGGSGSASASIAA